MNQVINVTGQTMPAVGLGLWKLETNEVAEAVYNAIKNGYRHLDSAADYGNEQQVGEGIARALKDGLCSREDLWITSKLWNTFHRKEYVQRACEKSLSDLGIDYFDLYLIHFPIALQYVDINGRYPPEWIFDPQDDNPTMELDSVPLSETWAAMESLAENQLARQIGVCNYSAVLLHDLMSYARIKPAMLQIESHPYLTQDALIRTARSYNIAVTAFSPLGALSYVSLDMASKGEGIESIADWLKSHKKQLEKDLAAHGAILFRDLKISNDKEFDRFIRAFDWPSFTYEESLSNAVRQNRTDLVFTANEAPPSVSIFLHHEMAQTPIYPSKLFFFCEQAPESGGATPICRSDILLEHLNREIPEFVESCESLGLRYSQTMPAENDLASGQGRSWRSTLSAETIEEAETKLSRLGYQWEWGEGGALSVTTPVLPAIRTAKDGRKVFFNQLIAAFRGWQDARNVSEKSICFGDYSTISNDDMAIVIRLSDLLTFEIPWQTGDVVLVDNFLAMHGRRPFEGQRRVLASLVA